MYLVLVCLKTTIECFQDFLVLLKETNQSQYLKTVNKLELFVMLQMQLQHVISDHKRK